METQEHAGLLGHFAELEDPRTRRSPHGLTELLLTAICAVLRAEPTPGWRWRCGRAKLAWLRQFLPFAHGVASHDTFGRVFALLDARVFERCFIAWMRTVCRAFDDHRSRWMARRYGVYRPRSNRPFTWCRRLRTDSD
ncbi:MAG: transposase family protein [Methylotetracoccus sp.]